jgi:hypothetical protein
MWMRLIEGSNTNLVTIPESQPLSLSVFGPWDLEYYLLAAYQRVIWDEASKEPPDFFEIINALEDELDNSGVNSFYVRLSEYRVSWCELSYDFIEETMIRMNMEFINMEGVLEGDARNILLEGWFYGQ